MYVATLNPILHCSHTLAQAQESAVSDPIAAIDTEEWSALRSSNHYGTYSRHGRQQLFSMLVLLFPSITRAWIALRLAVASPPEHASEPGPFNAAPRPRGLQPC